MEKIKNFDNLNISKDKEILKQLDNEKIFFSDIIVKINQIGKNQERIFILTNKHVYNFKKKTLKRKIPLSSILGLSYSSISNEFIIHGKNEYYDYSYLSQSKLIIIYLITLICQEFENIDMQICEINEKSLKNYVTHERDKKKNKQATKMDLLFQIKTKNFLFTNKKLVEKEKGEKHKHSESSKNLRMMSYSDYKDFIIMESKIKIEHFKLYKEIDRDIFGPLLIGRYLKDNNLYFLKCIRKDFILENKLIENKVLEKKILQNMDYPFINKMTFCFQRDEKIFFGFKYTKVNNLYNELCSTRFFSEDRVKFYASIIGLTLQFLHKKNIIYRDFNLKNILLTDEGYLLFTNFHNVKLISDPNSKNLKYYCSPEYMAPEIISGEGQSKMSDWWTFGIIIFEMLFGFPPFFDDSDDKIYDMILNSEIKFPKKNNISAEAKDLLQKLLIKEKNDRLGFEGGFEVIKNHYFFKGVDFINLEKKQIEPPFKPIINDFDTNIENDEIFLIFDPNKDFNLDDISETKLEYLKKNQDLFTDFYE